MRMSFLPADTSAVIAAEKSDRIGYIRRGSPTRTIETRPLFSVVRFISVHSTHSAFSTGAEIVAAKLLDLPRELVPPAIDPRFDGAFRQTQLVRDLVVRQLLDVAHQDSRSQRLRQRAQRFTQEFHAIALFHH